MSAPLYAADIILGMGREVVVGGYAKMPEGTGARRLYETLTVSVLVDRESNIVLCADSTLLTTVGREWISGHLVGIDLLVEPNPFLALVERDFWGQSQAALMQAFRDLVRRYRHNIDREDQASADAREVLKSQT